MGHSPPRHRPTGGSPFCVPADDCRAAELAIRDAQRARALWHQHGKERRVLARRLLAEQAKHLERQVIRTADTLKARAALRDADTGNSVSVGESAA